MITPVIAVLCGGTSAEREVSLGSGKACAIALARSFPTQLIELDAAAVPREIDARRHVVFSTLHGTFGEDGGMQRLLDAAGIAYAGCDAAASALTIDKTRTKQTVAGRGVRSPRGVSFDAANKPTAEALAKELGERVVLKPNAEGSSVGLFFADDRVALARGLEGATHGLWIAEERVVGKELSVGVLDGRAMGVVEIRPKSGVYDYASKYTKGMTDYFAPAPLPEEVTQTVRAAAEAAFAACGCRDYARVDFLLNERNEAFFLEINTLPGMKETSLLPMSARVAGMDFTALVKAMILPAVQRFRRANRA